MTANPIVDVESDAKAVALAEAYRHQPEPLEAEFAALACAHPEACACEDDPGWAAFIARQTALNNLWRQAARFNAANPVGTPVIAYPGIRPDHPVAVAFRKRAASGLLFREDTDPCTRLVTTTRSRATVLGGHTPVVWVNGHSACIALAHIDVHRGGAA